MKAPTGEGVGTFYRIMWRTCRTLVFSLWRLKIIGLENVPAEGGGIICPNHRSSIDPPLMSALLPRPLYHMTKAELFAYLGWLLPSVAAYPVRRGTGDMRAMRTSLTLLRAGRLICIFPEGTRTKTGELGEARRGATYLAAHTGVPIIPVGISATYAFFSTVTVRFGRPMHVTKSDDDAAKVMDAIAALVALGPAGSRAEP